MSNYTASQASDLVSDLEAPFLAMRQRYEEIHDIVFNRYDYRKDLSPDLEPRKSMGPSLLRRYLAMSKARMRTTLTLHLEPVDGTRNDAADRMEVLQAHDLFMLDPQSHHNDDMNHYQSIGPFWAGWLEMNDYLPPAREQGESEEDWTERSKKLRESFFNFSLTHKDWRSVSFMETDRKPTLAGTRLRLPYIDLIERYASDYGASREDRDKMLRICGEHFPFIRTDEGRAFDASDWDSFAAGEAEIVIAADRDTIWHYTDLSRRDKRGNLIEGKVSVEALGKDGYENPFGDVPLLICEGVYNPDQVVSHRREGIIHSLIEIEHGKAFYKSYWASMTANPPERYEDPPDQVKIHLLENPEDTPDNFKFMRDHDGRPIIGRSLGTIREAERAVDDMSDKIYGIFDQESQIASVSGVLFDPDAGQRLQNIPVSSVLAQNDALADLFGESMRSKTNMWNRGLNMMMTARRSKLNDHRKKGDKETRADWGSSFRTLGKEKVVGRRIDAGQQIKVSAQDYDGDYIRSIEPVDDRASTRAAQRAEADNSWQRGTMLYDKYLEAYGIENVTEFKVKKYEESIFQIESPRLLMDVRAKVAQFTAILNGSTIEEQLAGLAPEIAGQLAGAFGQQQGYSTGSNANMVQVQSPAGQNIGQDTTSRAQQ